MASKYSPIDQIVLRLVLSYKFYNATFYFFNKFFNKSPLCNRLSSLGSIGGLATDAVEALFFTFTGTGRTSGGVLAASLRGILVVPLTTKSSEMVLSGYCNGPEPPESVRLVLACCACISGVLWTRPGLRSSGNCHAAGLDQGTSGSNVFCNCANANVASFLSASCKS